MKPNDLMKFAVTGLKRRAARTFLTVLGVIIGTVCIVLMFAIGLSNYRQFEEGILADRRLTEITISDSSGSGGGMDVSPTGGGTAGITDATVASLRAIPYVKAVSPVIDLSVAVTAGRYAGSFQLRGMDPEALDLDFEEGGMFSGEGAVLSVVLGGNTLINLTDPDNPPNYSDPQVYDTYRPDLDLLDAEMEMELGYGYGWQGEGAQPSRRYRAAIAGVTKKSYGEQSYYAYVSLAAAQKLIAENRELAQSLGVTQGAYNRVIVLADDIENVEDVLAEVKKLGFDTYSPTEDIMMMREEQARQQGQLFAIGFISLFVSAIGIANTMYANILERRRDIGVMKVVGMKIRQIRSLFLAESALIGLLGGLIGIGASYVVALAINTGSGETSFFGMYFYGGMKVSIPLWLALGAMLIAVGVGVLSGVYPAYKATRMSPLEAMRGGK